MGKTRFMLDETRRGAPVPDTVASDGRFSAARPAWRRRLLSFALASLLVPALAAAAHGGGVSLGDLSGRSATRPVTFVLTSTAALAGLRWTDWGAPTATALGTLTINTCVPSCAAGARRVLPGAELEVRGRRLAGGQPFYGQYRVLSGAFTRQERAAYAAWSTAYVPSDFH